MLRAIPSAVLLLALSSLPAAAGPVTLLSKADPDRPSGTAGGRSDVVGISADGRYVLLHSNADNLLAGLSDANAGNDLFLHDRIAETTVLVSHAAGDPSTTGNAEVLNAALSADGRWVAFRSAATDLVAGQVDLTNTSDVFLWDRDSDVTRLVSHEPGLPTTAAGDCPFFDDLQISADGGRIAFVRRPASEPTVFLYDRAADTNTLVSHASSSATVSRHGGNPALSADGHWVVFRSSATDLVAGQLDTNGTSDLFLYEVATGTNVLVSHAAGSTVTAGNAGFPVFELTSPQISADGGWIAYTSLATNLMAGQSDGNGDADVFLYDRATGTNILASHAASSAMTAGNQSAEAPALSADGRYVAFASDSSDLVAGDTNGWLDVFVYDRVAGTNTLVSRQGATPANLLSFQPSISSDGAWIAFLSHASNLVPGQIDDLGSQDAFLWSRATGSITLVTRTPDSATTAVGISLGNIRPIRISADGSWMALSCPCENLLDGIDDHNGLSDAFLFERATGAHRLLTPRGGAVSASAGGYLTFLARTAVSNDGRYTVFASEGSNLPGIVDGNHRTDIFLHDRIAETTTLVSHASGSPSTTGDGASSSPLLSTDGSVVVFQSVASDLVPGSGPLGQLYVYERATGAITLISHAPSSPTTRASGSLEDGRAVSGDGRWIAFAHSGSLIDGQVDGNGGADVFLFDRATGINTLVSHASSSPTQTGDGISRHPSISADGRYLAFASTASDLLPGQAGAGGIFLYDRIAGTTTRVSSSAATSFAISADGRWIVFTSSATDVVPGQVDTNSASDVFLWDRVSGSALLVSRAPASPTTTGNAGSDLDTFSVVDAPALSADGRWVTFYSRATNLISGQTGDSVGVFLFDRLAGTVTLVSRSAASPTTVRSASKPAISADGRFVAFRSSGFDLVPGQVNQGLSSNYFLYDRIAGTNALMSHIPASVVTSGMGDSKVVQPHTSADGAWVVFESGAPDLVADDHDGTFDIFLHANPLPGRDFYTVAPCRIVDTRQAGQGPVLTSGLKRIVTIHGTCGIPATARAVAVNVTVIGPSAEGHLTLHPGDLAPETDGTIFFAAGQTRANNAILSLAFDGRGTLAVTPFVEGNGTVHLIVDVSGYFE